MSTQVLPLSTFVFVDAVTCCTGSSDIWGQALHVLCQLLTAVWQRPIAVIRSYRLGPDPTRPHVSPAHTCRGKCRNMRMDPNDAEARLDYHRRLCRTLQHVWGFESAVLATGSAAQWTCLLPDRMLLHAAVAYPVAQFMSSVEAVWRRNARHMLLSAGYDNDLVVLGEQP